MIINNILIIDTKNKEANKYIFKERANIIVSNDNTQGKSSLLKSIFFALGLDVKNFPVGWNTADMIFQLTISEKKHTYKITRFRDKYKIDNSKFMSGLPYSLKLQEILEINMQLPNTRTKKLSEAYSSATILPFYVDQDTSWQGIPYKSVSNATNQYSEVPKSIFEYVFGLSDEDIQELNIKKGQYSIEKDNLAVQVNVLKEYMIEEQNTLSEITNVSPLDEEALESQINYYLKVSNTHNEEVKKYKVHLIEYKNRLNSIEQDIKELKKLLTINRKEYNEIESICSHCNSHLTIEQSLRRLDTTNNILEIQETILLYEEEKEKTINKIEEYQLRKKDIQEKIRHISFEVTNSKALLEIQEYIDASAKEKAITNLKTNILKKTTLKENVEENIKEINSKIGRLKKEKKELKDELNSEYVNTIMKMSLELSGITLNQLDFLQFKNLSGSGMNTNKLYLAYYITYFNLIERFGRYSVPFGMDSFIKNESSSENESEMFKVIVKYMLNLNHQSFFSILDENLKYINPSQNYNFVNIGKRVLNSKYYDMNKSMIESILIEKIDR